MTKNVIDLTDVYANIRNDLTEQFGKDAKGLEVALAAIAKHEASQFVSPLLAILEKKMVTDLGDEAYDSDELAEVFMSLAETFANSIVGEATTFHGSLRTVRVIGFDSPQGHMQIKLTSGHTPV